MLLHTSKRQCVLTELRECVLTVLLPHVLTVLLELGILVAEAPQSPRYWSYKYSSRYSLFVARVTARVAACVA